MFSLPLLIIYKISIYGGMFEVVIISYAAAAGMHCSVYPISLWKLYASWHECLWDAVSACIHVIKWKHDVTKWKHFPRYWPFVRGIHRSPVNSPHKGQWRGALMFSFICVWINGWVNNREAGDLRRYRAHYDVTVMDFSLHAKLSIICRGLAPDSPCCVWCRERTITSCIVLRY